VSVGDTPLGHVGTIAPITRTEAHFITVPCPEEVDTPDIMTLI